LRVLQFGQLEGLVSMPSFHVAGAMMVTWACRRRRWLLIPLLAINITLAVATFMTGAHYVVDTLGTAAMFAGSIWLWRNWGVHMLRARLTPSEAQT
jgi:membrane-associated phospholipid phosphatase